LVDPYATLALAPLENRKTVRDAERERTFPIFRDKGVVIGSSGIEWSGNGG
jgi:hypothetical protein